MNRCRIAVAAALTTAAGLLAIVPGAGAAFHLTKISEVHPGNPNADAAFIELQFFSDGQNFLTGHDVDYYTANGNLLGSTALMMVPNGQSQRTVLIGDTAVAGADITNMNLGDALSVATPGGAVCFHDGSPPDCVAWGNFNDVTMTVPEITGVGSPVAPGGIGSGQSISRRISPGCPTLLEAGDDTDNSSVDFTLGALSPRSNAVTPTEKACPSSGTPGKKKRKRKCKKKPSKNIAASAKKKKCKKKKKR